MLFIHLLYCLTYFLINKTKVNPSPIPSAAKLGNYRQYHELLDQHKQQMADGERNMDEWNKSSDINNICAACSKHRDHILNEYKSIVNLVYSYTFYLRRKGR